VFGGCGRAGFAIAIRQAGTGLLDRGACGVSLDPPCAQPVVQIEMRFGLVLGGDQLAVRINIGMLPRYGSRNELAELVSCLVADVVCLSCKTILGRIATPTRDRALGHPVPIHVVDVTGHYRHAVVDPLNSADLMPHSSYA